MTTSAPASEDVCYSSHTRARLLRGEIQVNEIVLMTFSSIDQYVSKGRWISRAISP